MHIRIAYCTAMVAVFMVSMNLSAHAQSPQAVRSLAATCTACHGTDGNSVGGIPPGIAGQSKDYLLQQLIDFKTGKRPATIMHQHAKGYSDEQLAQLAAYFAAVKPAAAAAAPRGGN